MIWVNDLNHRYTVPFYDGQVRRLAGEITTGSLRNSGDIMFQLDSSMGSQERLDKNLAATSTGGHYGEPGTLKEDLQRLQVALKAKGFDPENKLVANGIYSVETEEAVKLATEAMEDAGFTHYVSKGKNGIIGDTKWDSTWGWTFDTQWIYAWNSYIMYGTLEKAQSVGKTALAYAAVESGMEFAFLRAVCLCESGYIPTSESEVIPHSTDFPGKSSFKDYNNFLLSYHPEGQPRVIRRAQGVMQLLYIPGSLSAYDIAPSQELAAIRTPATNAYIGAMHLRDHLIRVQKNPKLGDDPAFKVDRPLDRISEILDYSEKNRGSAWVKATRYMDPDYTQGSSARRMIMYCLTSIMYHKGWVYPEDINNLKNARWENEKLVIPNDSYRTKLMGHYIDYLHGASVNNNSQQP